MYQYAVYEYSCTGIRTSTEFICKYTILKGVHYTRFEGECVHTAVLYQY